MNFKKKLIRVEEIVDAVKSNPLYSWELRLFGCVDFIGVVEDSYGNKFWYKEGKRHRLDGPAYEGSDGDKYWYQEGKYHRIEGPAIEDLSGIKAWYLKGIRYSKSKFNNKVKGLK